MDHQFNAAEDFLLDDSFLRYCIGIDEQDIAYWEKWIADHPHKRADVARARQIFDIINGRQGRLDEEVSHFKNLLEEHIGRETAVVPKVRPIGRWRAAAAVLLLLGAAGAWLAYRHWHAPSGQEIALVKGGDVQPGGAKARLQLGDGTSVELDSLNGNGLKEKDGTRIGKDNGKLVYDVTGNSANEITYNTLSTPRGGEFQLVLPDGTKVWLNAASSLRFPTKFTGTERTVYLSGEAYFEVAQQASQPFQVQVSNGLKVAVLGTGFNIMAYDDENVMNTTLVSGKVKVIAPGGNSVLLSPSEQAVLARGSRDLSVSEADIDKTIAWKMGMFEFDDDDISTVMRQLARWYDVNVKFSGPVPDKHYTGSIRKQSTLSQALHILKTAGVQFRINGKQIVVEAK